MCGIVGKLYLNPKKNVSAQLIKKMAGAIAHRGPDDEGVWTKGQVGLGNRRLAIIDLSPAGHQPMSNIQKTLWITFNGEIYNFPELRKHLEEKGYRFRSKTDTEVILYLYQEYGTECLRYLRGMFAFALWDDKKQQLFAARDRIGKKPFKYYIGPDFFIFASEAKALFKDPAVPKTPDFEAVSHYLSFGYVPGPGTGFAGVKKLPPGHYLIVKSSGELTLERYWRLDYKEKWQLSEKEWTQKILAKLREAVRSRLISDVPLGAMLSGGIDSSTVVALMSEASERPVKTFSIGFEETAYNELADAKIVAQKFKTEHQEFIVKPEAIKILPKLAYAFEEPFADSSAIPSWYLAAMTRQEVTVALNGDGGDENFAGYNRYLAYKIDLWYSRLPRWLRKGVVRYSRGRDTPVARFFQTSLNNPAENYFRRLLVFSDAEKQRGTREPFSEELAKAPAHHFWRVRCSLQKAWLDSLLSCDIGLQLPDDLLVKMDIATMSHSLEARSPFLDHEFLELCAKIPGRLKLRGMTTKYILKRALKNILSPQTLEKSKQGFDVPIREWLRKELNGYMRDKLLGSKSFAQTIFKTDYLEELIREHTSSQKDESRKLWTLLILEEWFRTWW